MSKTLALEMIRIDGGTQSRKKLNDAVVAEYAQAIKAGASMPAVTVFFDGIDHWLADGFHRYHGHRTAKKKSIEVVTHGGTQRDAVFYSLSANLSHGLQRTNADKRLAVETMLKDAEWGQWSDREIGKACGVTHTFVSTVRSPDVAEQRRENRTRSQARVEPGSTSEEVKPVIAPALTVIATPVPSNASASLTEEDQLDAEIFGDFDAATELKVVQSKLLRAEADIAAMQADDLKAEVLKWKSASATSERTASDKSANALRYQQELQKMSERLLRIGKLFNERDPLKIPGLVEDFVRKHTKVAA